MEVYGAHADRTSDSLQEARTNAFTRITQFKFEAEQCLIRLKALSTAQRLVADLEIVLRIVDKLHKYWSLKFRANSQVLFTSQEPAVEKVGHIVKLTCGHNGRPSYVEIALIAAHIERSGLVSVEQSDSLTGLDEV